jgi:thiamine biosynthesis lipoprotein
VTRAGRLFALAVAVAAGCREVRTPAPSATAGGPPPAPATEAAGGPSASARAAASSTPAPDFGGPARAPAEHAGKHERVELVERAMGTRVVLAAFTDATHDAATVRAALARAHAEIVRLEGLMTTWRDDSEIARLNAAAGKAAVAVSEESFTVLEKSLWISGRSEGVFDVTFASMGKLWRFDQDRDNAVPERAALEEARKRIDWRAVLLDRRARTAMLAHAHTRVDLGGIAKGYAIDRAADVLRRAGLGSFYCQAGGDLYVEGNKPWGEPWRVGVRDPRGGEGDYFALLPVESHAFSTAGDYERSFVKDGKRYHHIIDPRTGWPATASRSVTVWARDALTADAVDDAVFILGPEKGLALVESLEDCGAVIVDARNKVWISKRLEGRVQILRPPTDGV